MVFRYEKLGRPPQELWDGVGGTVMQIRDWLELPAGADCRFIKTVLERHPEGEALSQYNQSGRKPKLTEGESRVAADCLERGLARVVAREIGQLYTGLGQLLQLQNSQRISYSRRR